MRTRLLLCLTLSCAGAVAPRTASSQAGPRRSELTLGVTLSDLRIRDEFLSPVGFGGALPGASASYIRDAGRSLQVVEVQAVVGSLSAGAASRVARQHLGSISLAYLRRLHGGDGTGRSLALYVGGGISSSVANTNYDVTDRSAGYTFYDQSWYWSHSLDLQLFARYGAAHRSRLSLHGAGSLLRLVSRPENAHYFNARNARVIHHFLSAATMGSLTPGWDSPVLTLQLDYRHPLGRQIALAIGYDFSYATAHQPLPLRMYRNGVRAGLGWAL